MCRRLHLVPKLRKVVRLPLLGESSPVWVDDPDFDISYHVREAAVPEPGDDAQLLELCARLMSSPLDRDQPLWKSGSSTGWRTDASQCSR